MDREIPKKIRTGRRLRTLAKYSAGCAGTIGMILFLVSLMRSSVSLKDVMVSTVGRGTIETTMSASGVVVPAFEEVINSPITSRILEIYKKGGDLVEAGTPILKLDLQSVRTAYRKLLDEERMRRYKLEQLRINSRTRLDDLAMQIKISGMKLDRMKVELRNEHYMDSLGAGTTDKVRQADLNQRVAVLEFEQLNQQYRNEKSIADAEQKVQELDFSIFEKGLEEMRRTLDDARICSPRRAVLTYVDNQVGAQVGQGSRLAVISDLSCFRVDAEIADTYGDKVSVGGKATVRVGKEQLEGIVSNVNPLSRNGVISFSVQLKKDHANCLRSGLKTDVYVSNSVREDALRILNGSFYTGRGDYELFVIESPGELVKRKVRLGDSSFDYAEVVSGLRAGDRVVVSDMTGYKNKRKLKLK